MNYKFHSSKKTSFPKTFGMTVPNRQFNSGNYRFSYNGKEQDNEVKGTGNSLDFGARIYNSRIAKFLSLDAYSGKHADESNYSFVSNTPIAFKDIDGNDLSPTFKSPEAKAAFIKVVNANLGDQFQVQLTPIKGQINAFKVNIIATKGGGKLGNLNKFEKAFYTEVTKVINDKKVNVKVDIDYKKMTLVGNANALYHTIDMQDIEKAELSNNGKDYEDYTQTGAGLFVHEIIETYIMQSRGIIGNQGGEPSVYNNYYDQKDKNGKIIKKGAHTYANEAEERVNGVKEIGAGDGGVSGDRYWYVDMENGNQFRMYTSGEEVRVETIKDGADKKDEGNNTQK